MDLTHTIATLLSLFSGGVILKLTQEVLKHRRSVDGDYEKRNEESRDNFRLVVEKMEHRITQLEEAERRCLQENALLRDELRKLRWKVDAVVAQSPLRGLTIIEPEPLQAPEFSEIADRHTPEK